MTSYKSDKALISKPIGVVFSFLCAAENYRELMPSNVSEFRPTEQGADLRIQGLGEVKLAFDEKREFDLIKLIPTNKVPFEFSLRWELTEENGAATGVQAIIDAELNFMMRMMAEKLLNDFLNVQVHKLVKHLSDD